MLDDQGYFHGTTADVRRQAQSQAIRIEMRRQIDLGVRSGINHSHVDMTRRGDARTLDFVADVFDRLPAGLSCVLLHPAIDNFEIRSVTSDW